MSTLALAAEALPLIIKGIELIPQLVKAGMSVYDAVKRTLDFAKKVEDGTVTTEDVETQRRFLDDQLHKFIDRPGLM